MIDIKKIFKNKKKESFLKNLSKKDVQNIERGLVKFHESYEAFNEALYLELFNDINEAVLKGDFKSGFDHFVQCGYNEILAGKRHWPSTIPLKIENEVRNQNDDIFDVDFDVDFDKPLVSVVCITYNHEQYIKKALEGFVQQKTNFKFEIIVADDCSTDDTALIVKSYCEKYPGLIVPILRKNNIGPRNNFMDALSTAKGKYLALCEGDDFWIDPLKLQIQAAFLEKNPDYAICFHNVAMFKISSDDVRYFKTFPNVCNETTELKDIVKSNYIQTNSVMYRWIFENGVNENNFNPKAMPGDWYLHMLHANTGKIKFFNQIMSVYNIHGNGIWGSHHGNAIALHRKHGLKEIELFGTMDRYLQEEFHDNFYSKQKGIFRLLFNDFLDNEEYDKIFELMNAYPDIYKDISHDLGINLNGDIPENSESLKTMLRQAQKISVIITSYNHEKYIEKAINSVLMQKGCFELEIIMGDDCSADSTAMIIEKFETQYPTIIKVLKNDKNLGMLKNMQRCLSAATGEFVAICEGDDYWLSDEKIKKQLSFLRKNIDCSMCFNWILLYKEDENQYLPHSEQALIKGTRLTFDQLMSVPYTANFSACMYRKSTIESVPARFYELEKAADWLFNLCCAKVGDVGFSKDLMSVYRIHSKGQWSGQSQDAMQERIRELKQKHIEFFTEGSNLFNYFNKDLSNAQVQELSPMNDNGVVKYWIDTIECQISILNLKGWIFELTGSEMLVKPSGILFIDTETGLPVAGRYFSFHERKDIKKMKYYNRMKCTSEFFGISTSINIELPNENYAIGIFIDNKYLLTQYVMAKKLNSWKIVKND